MSEQSFFRDVVLKHAVTEAGRLVTFLNTASTAPESWRAMQVFELCQQLGELQAEPKSTAKRRESALLSALNAHLELFRFIPVRGPLSVFWREAPDNRSPAPVRPLTGKELSAMPVPVFHIDIIRVMLAMSEVGTLGRIRKCICGKWFFAQTNKKQVCSDACRFQKFQNSKQEDPKTFKRNHTKYMREYRKVKARRIKNGKTKTRKR